MKLRNKKTGAIYKIEDIDLGNNADGIWLGMTKYNSLAELNAEWEDYEEPKESEYYWYIGYKNDIRRTKYHHISDFADNQVTMTRKEIGNCFGSLEEAEKAVEKLKAWKLLKDMGFKIEGIRYRDNKNYIEWSISPKVRDDHFDGEAFNEVLHLLFGGEE